jgi:hypothetical protein
MASADAKKNQQGETGTTQSLSCGSVFEYLLGCPTTELSGYLAVIQQRLNLSVLTVSPPSGPIQEPRGNPRGRGRNRGRGKGRGGRSQKGAKSHPEKGGKLTQPKEVKVALEAYLAERERVRTQMSPEEQKGFKPTAHPALSRLYKEYESLRAKWLEKAGGKTPSSTQGSSSPSLLNQGGKENKEEVEPQWIDNPLGTSTAQPTPIQEAKAISEDLHPQTKTAGSTYSAAVSRGASKSKAPDSKQRDGPKKSPTASPKTGGTPTGSSSSSIQSHSSLQSESPASHKPGSGAPIGKPGHT